MVVADTPVSSIREIFSTPTLFLNSSFPLFFPQPYEKSRNTLVYKPVRINLVRTTQFPWFLPVGGVGRPKNRNNGASHSRAPTHGSSSRTKRPQPHASKKTFPMPFHVVWPVLGSTLCLKLRPGVARRGAGIRRQVFLIRPVGAGHRAFPWAPWRYGGGDPQGRREGDRQVRANAKPRKQSHVAPSYYFLGLPRAPCFGRLPLLLSNAWRTQQS